MKQAFKKTLSLILAFTLSLGFLPSTVFAVEGETGMQDSGIAKPALTIGVSSITDSGAVLEFTSDQDGTVYYLVQESSKDKPNASTLQSAESTAASAAEPVTIDEEDLLSDTAYTVYGIVVTEVSQSDDDVATNSEALDTGLSAAVTASPVVSRDFTTDRKNPAA
ncbi:MAG: hypothetical protein PHY23_08050, partial [Oscillospiraceae bacterium]|nr:hypothetical protein [Oscillospiraceae bacterium]